ncbi:MAG: HIT domain-containing protein [Parcubacteria group bacterium]|nr:HIT domain-containing protein [Parcubacteria group bacterium]
MDNNCVFCDRTKIGNRLIAENSRWYVAATLGQIIGGYTLVIPKVHISCMGALTSHRPGSQTEAMLKIAKETCRALSLEYRHSNSATPCPVTAFEHGIIGQTIKHAHLHLLPTAIDLTQKIRADFPESEFEELQYAARLQELYSKRPEPYLFWTTPNGKSMVCWNPPAPSQYLRIIIAEILGYPERGNWRNMDPELDKKLWQETVNRLRPYFKRREI